MILPEKNPERTEIVLVFNVDDQEEAERLHEYRAAFAGATEIEALDEHNFVLRIRPGHPGCPCDGGEAA